jgi:ADP-ribose pyrophosphatase YjhB (NUDIX family)
MVFGEDFAEMHAPLPVPIQRRPSTEKKFGDEMLARWEKTPLPEDADVVHLTLIPYRGERAVVPRKQGRMQLPEGEVKEGESVEAAIERIAREQAGILNPTSSHLGHFRCRTTVYSKSLPPDTINYRALYGVEVGGLADAPEDETFERRIILQRDLIAMIRERYNEFTVEYTDALDDFIIERTKRMLAQSAGGEQT